MPLLEITNGYDLLYKWFDLLKIRGYKILGYVPMLNHVHVLISFINTHQLINTIVGNGKRFIAYDIIKRLKEKQEKNVLDTLSKNVEAKRRANNKLHEVWDLSFDWLYCNSATFIKQKLNYIHDNLANLCIGKWSLCKKPINYLYSSAKHYLQGIDVYTLSKMWQNETKFGSKTQRPLREALLRKRNSFV